MPDQAPQICGITRATLKDGEELWRIRLDADAAQEFTADYGIDDPGLEPGMYAVCLKVAQKFRERVARIKGVPIEQVGMRDLA